jgi:hypothetical protein
MRTNYPLAFGIKKSGDNPFSDPHKKTKKTEVDDPWSQAYKPTDAIIGDQIDFSALKSSLQNSDDDQDTSFDLHAVTKINASPGGYCLSWLEDTPIQLRTGELVAIRDGHPEWAIGVVRWVRQLPNGGAEFGVEVMAPRAQPCAAKAVKKTGEEANFMRALLLPALQAVGLLQGGENSRVLLTRQLSGSASYNLYLFRDASPGSDKDELPQPEQPNDNKNQFDSIWSNL